MTDLISRLRTHPEFNQRDRWLLDDAADEIERLRAELANVNNEFGSQTADWPDAWKRVADLKQLSNDRWREAERLRAALRNLLDMDADLDAAIDAASAAPQQPMHCPEDGGKCGAGGYCRPEPVQRRPLSDEQINRLDTEAIHGGPDSQYAFRFARAVEKAHSITGEQK